jgi:hypothetical protein
MKDIYYILREFLEYLTSEIVEKSKKLRILCADSAQFLA